MILNKTNVNRLGKRWVAIIKQLLANNKPYPKIATGNLIQTLDYNTLQDENGDWIIEIKSARAQNGFEYLKVVDQGRKPGKYVPIRPLIEWVRIKGMEDGAAYAISKKIAKKGIKATFIIKQSVDQLLNPDTINQLEEEIAQEIVDITKLKLQKV
jgi:hypothetical protein